MGSVQAPVGFHQPRPPVSEAAAAMKARWRDRQSEWPGTTVDNSVESLVMHLTGHSRDDLHLQAKALAERYFGRLRAIGYTFTVVPLADGRWEAEVKAATQVTTKRR